jgi:predicted GIY-YIG superfamily endonuclease
VTVIRQAAAAAPADAGVYFFLGEGLELLYVGKAANLRRRLRQHGAPQATGRLADVYPLVREVRWEPAANDHAAAVREADVLLALRPAFNASLMDDGRWNHILVGHRADDPAHLTLALSPEVGRRPARTYGCFPYLGAGQSSVPGIACSDGYIALLRLLWATSPGPGSPFPRSITGGTPPDSFSVRATQDVVPLLHAFLSGTRERLLATLDDVAVDEYVRPALRRDRVAASAFFSHGPRALRALRLRHGLRPGPVSRSTFEAMIGDEVRAAIGDVRAVETPDPTAGLLGRRDTRTRTLAATRARTRSRTGPGPAP